MSSHRDEDRIKSLIAQFADCEITSCSAVQLQFDIAGLDDFAHLRFNHAARKSVLGYPEIQHAAGYRGRVEERDPVTHEREIVGCRETYRTGADDCDSKRELFNVGRLDIQWMS